MNPKLPDGSADEANLQKASDLSQSEAWNETLGDAAKLLRRLLEIQRDIERVLSADVRSGSQA